MCNYINSDHLFLFINKFHNFISSFSPSLTSVNSSIIYVMEITLDYNHTTHYTHIWLFENGLLVLYNFIALAYCAKHYMIYSLTKA